MAAKMIDSSGPGSSYLICDTKKGTKKECVVIVTIIPEMMSHCYHQKHDACNDESEAIELPDIFTVYTQDELF